MGARAATRFTWGVGQRMQPRSVWGACACACAVTRERRTDKERRSAGPHSPWYQACIVHGIELCTFHAFRYMFHMFHLDVAYVSSRRCMCFHLDVAYVPIDIHVCCKCVCFICIRRMLQVFYLNVAYVLVAIYICCNRLFKMFHMFQTYVASVLSRCCICCSWNTHMSQAYIANVSHVSDVASCCNISRRMRRRSPRARQAKWVWGGLHLHAHQQT
jgi:hypothetical protein